MSTPTVNPPPPPPFDREAVTAHIVMLHELAAGCEGYLTLLPVFEGSAPHPQRFRIGDVAGMVRAAMGYDGVWGCNLFAPYCLMRTGLEANQKGGEKDVTFSFAAVRDRDCDKHEQVEIPLVVSYSISSSPGNFQDVFAYPRPLPANVAKALLVALHAAIGGDSAQKDLSHVWRIPGTLNWPTKAKLARGRSPIPAPVTVAKSFNGTRVTLTEMLALKPLTPPKVKRAPATAKPRKRVDKAELASALGAIPADDRDVWLRHGMACHAAGARPEWDEWSKASSKYDEADQERVWQSFDGDREDGVGPGTTFAEAKKNGWKPPPGEFVRGENGAILKNHPGNIALAIGRLGVRLRLNEFANQTELAGLDGFGPLLDDASAIRIRLAIHEQFEFLPPEALCASVLADEAHKGRFHPVRLYLTGLNWDGERRLDRWLHTYLGAAKSDYSTAIGKMFLIALVARIFQPGCKADYMIILEGPQGAMKSAACRVIAGEWFSDSLPEVREHKDLAQHLRGKWLIEVSELSAMTRTETNTLKAFVTREEERYRPPYGRHEVIEPRQCLFVGTVNEHEYLRDATGGRRFWPQGVGVIDLISLKADRDQLFAEAVQLYRAGVHWWPSPQFEAKHIRDEQEARYVEDPWRGPVAEHLAKLTEKRVTVGGVARDALSFETARIGMREAHRIRDVLTQLGWVQRRSNGVRGYEPQ
jgi:hypothetical protein